MRRAGTQLPLDLGHRPALGGEDFLVAGSNAEAVAWLDRWPDWPGHMLALYGPAGCGKSHLANVFAARSGAAVVTADSVTVESVPGLLATDLVVEDGDRGLDERAMFHLCNAAKEAGRHLLLTGRLAPARWPVALPDLRSRLSAAPTAEIAPPDDQLMAAVLVKLFADRQLKVGQEVIAYLLARLERSFAAARAVVASIDETALAGHRPVTLPLLRGVLDSQGELPWT